MREVLLIICLLGLAFSGYITMKHLDCFLEANQKKLKKETFEAAALEQIPFNEPIEEEKEFKIVRTKRFSTKPMSAEEAILQMNLLGHQFYIFTNSENGEPNVVYKRRNGNYGLIELV